MRIDLQGGFGEKGRTSVAVSGGATRIMLDAGIMVGASGDDYHPRLARPAAEIGALFISHAHEDHIGALGRLLGQGFAGPVWMTAQTREEMPAALARYARTEDRAHLPPPGDRLRLFAPGETIRAGGLTVETGHSGHVAGGVWFAVSGGGRRMVYCADLVPDSPVFPMTPPPPCDLAILDASYGADATPARDRARDIAGWIAGRPGGCVLPTPLSGRSLELMALLERPFAIAADMREALARQIGAGGALRPGMAARLSDRLGQAEDWTPGSPLPPLPLLTHDGMGAAGPSAEALALAEAGGHPVLLTGHLPEGSPGARMRAQGGADWIRMPTHPTLPETLRLWEGMGRPRCLGHSCDAGALAALHPYLPALDPDARTGQTLTL